MVAVPVLTPSEQALGFSPMARSLGNLECASTGLRALAREKGGVARFPRDTESVGLALFSAQWCKGA